MVASDVPANMMFLEYNLRRYLWMMKDRDDTLSF